MAVDTRDKRGSVIGLALAPLWPLADSSINQGDRQQVSHIYRGILAGAPPEPPAVPESDGVAVRGVFGKGRAVRSKFGTGTTVKGKL